MRNLNLPVQIDNVGGGNPNRAQKRAHMHSRRKSCKVRSPVLPTLHEKVIAARKRRNAKPVITANMIKEA